MELAGSTARPLTPRRWPPAELASGSTAAGGQQCRGRGPARVRRGHTQGSTHHTRCACARCAPCCAWIIERTCARRGREQSRAHESAAAAVAEAGAEAAEDVAMKRNQSRLAPTASHHPSLAAPSPAEPRSHCVPCTRTQTPVRRAARCLLARRGLCVHRAASARRHVGRQLKPCPGSLFVQPAAAAATDTRPRGPHLHKTLDGTSLRGQPANSRRAYSPCARAYVHEAPTLLDGGLLFGTHRAGEHTDSLVLGSAHVTHDPEPTAYCLHLHPCRPRAPPMLIPIHLPLCVYSPSYTHAIQTTRPSAPR